MNAQPWLDFGATLRKLWSSGGEGLCDVGEGRDVALAGVEPGEPTAAGGERASMTATASSPFSSVVVVGEGEGGTYLVPCLLVVILLLFLLLVPVSIHRCGRCCWQWPCGSGLGCCGGYGLWPLWLVGSGGCEVVVVTQQMRWMRGGGGDAVDAVDARWW